MFVRTIAVTAAAAVLLIGAVEPAASASSSERGTGSSQSTALPAWQTYRSAAFSYAPGAVCQFGLSGTPVRDEEQDRTLQSYPDGNPELNEYRGPLYVRFTNASTGRSVVRNLSGYGFLQFADSGALNTALFLSNGAVHVNVGNVGYPSGYYVLHGQFVVQDDAVGNRVIIPVHAASENLCRTLG